MQISFVHWSSISEDGLPPANHPIMAYVRWGDGQTEVAIGCRKNDRWQLYGQNGPMAEGFTVTDWAYPVRPTPYQPIKDTWIKPRPERGKRR